MEGKRDGWTEADGGRRGEGAYVKNPALSLHATGLPPPLVKQADVLYTRAPFNLARIALVYLQMPFLINVVSVI